MSDGLPDDKLTISRVTELEAKVDQLYRALADIPLVIKPHSCYDRMVFSCPVCEWGKDDTNWPEWADPAEHIEHANGCLRAEAIEYVNSNPKAER